MSLVKRVRLLLLVGLIVLLFVLGPLGAAVAAQSERGVSLTTTYPNITITKYQAVSLPVRVANQGKVDERLTIAISAAPSGWETRLVDSESDLGYGVRSLYLLAGEGPRLIYLRAKPPAGVVGADYTFVVRATSTDGVVQTTLTITVGVEEKAIALGRFNLTTTYPVLSGARGSKFEFTVAVTNEGSEDRTVNFSANMPPDWKVAFSPAFESTKQVSTIAMKAGETTSMRAEFTSPEGVALGKYEVSFVATSGEISGAIPLTILVEEAKEELTYRLDMWTVSGRLDAEATAGREGHLSIVVANLGTGNLEGVALGSTKPEGWLVAYTPPTIPLLAPGERREVDVVIKPTSKAIAGDYPVTLRGSGTTQGDAKLELRVKVGTAATWGWLGIGIVLLVIAAVATLFFRLGRR